MKAMYRLALCSVSTAVFLVPIAAHAQSTLSTAVTLTGTIRPSGPRQGANGDNFMNIEGDNNGTNASYAILRFDVSSLKSGFDAQFGAGHYQITGVALQLTQSNAQFTANGGLNFAFSTDDTSDIKTTASPFKYPTPAPVQELLASGAFVQGSETHSGQAAGTGHVDSFQLLTGNQASIDLANDILQGTQTTLVINPGDASVAATYRGQVPTTLSDGTVIAAPTLFVTAKPVPAPAALMPFLTGVSLIATRLRRRRAA